MPQRRREAHVAPRRDDVVLRPDASRLERRGRERFTLEAPGCRDVGDSRTWHAPEGGKRGYGGTEGHVYES